MKRLQVYIPEELLTNLRIYAESQGIPLAEALRRAGNEFTTKIIVKKTIQQAIKRKKQKSKDPLLAMAGMFKSGPRNASTTVDDIYDDI